MAAVHLIMLTFMVKGRAGQEESRVRAPAAAAPTLCVAEPQQSLNRSRSRSRSGAVAPNGNHY